MGLLYRDGKYDLDFKSPNPDRNKAISVDKLKDTYLGYIKEFPIVFIEDPFAEDDWDAWPMMTGATDIQVSILIFLLYLLQCSELIYT